MGENVVVDQFEISSMARKVSEYSPRLKVLFKDSDANIYVKPDRTKSERDEYTRLGKRKTELLNQHPDQALKDSILGWS